MRGKLKDGFVIVALGIICTNLSSVSAESESGLSYLRSLGDDTQIYVWPSSIRTYEIVSGSQNVTELLDKYKSDRGDIFNFISSPNSAQISIISTGGPTIELLKSKMMDGYRSYLNEAPLNSDGCTSYKFLSRGTWVAFGAIIVDERKLSTELNLMRCIYSALDYINGVPARMQYFSYKDMPELEESNNIIRSIYICANEKNKGGKDSERTRDGIAPLPSVQCVVGRM